MSYDTMSGVAVAVLASGGSSRLGHPKQLVVYEGDTLIRSVIGKVSALGCGRVGVVLGAHIAEILPELDEFDVSLIVNDDWRSGLGSSLRTAVQWAMTGRCEALLVVLVDQVDVTTRHLSELISCWQAGRTNVGSAYDGIVGVPAIFDAKSFGQILQLNNGDIGARFLLRQTPAQSVACPAAARDVDTQADVDRLSGA